jgi:hypothetical protein
MKKYTKIGLSALCGSLASISAVNAGSIEVTGSAMATWTSLGGQVTGNPIGMATGLTFTGNGELDGGQTFSVGIAHANKQAYSSANITLNTNSTGTFKLSSAEGGAGIGGYDDNMPTAWEEVWDTGIATNANFQKGVGSSTNISWKSPKVAGTTFQIAYAPANDGDQTNKKGVSGVDSNFGSGWDIVLDTGTADGAINMFVGGSRTELDNKVQPTLRDLSGDHEEAVVGLKFKFGPVALGGQISAERLRTRTVNTAEYYGNSSWGLAFNVNDDLSVSYSEARHLMTKTHKASYPSGFAASQTNEYTPKSWMRGQSIQAAYTIGGVALKYARTRYDNTAFSFDAKIPRESQMVAVSLAF